MTVRVSADAVREIIDVDSSLSLTPFIEAATLTVDEHLSDESLSDDLLKEIERWLAAHFVAIREQRVKSEKVGDAAATYHGQSGKGLEFTPYGQQAVLLDPTGKLASIGKRPAQLYALDLDLDDNG